MTPIIPDYAKSKYYDGEKDVLLEGASDQDKADYEDLHNGADWCLFYKELEPDMEIPYKQWDGTIVDIGKANEDEDVTYTGNDGIKSAAKKIAEEGANADIASEYMTDHVKRCGAYFQLLGYNEKPQKASLEEFEAIKSEFPVMYRGFHSQEYLDDFVNSDTRMISRGHAGCGTNTTVNPGEANDYSKSQGYVCQMKLKPGAQVIRDTDLIRIVQDHWQDKMSSDVLETLYTDPGTLAASLGYDAVWSPTNNWFNVMNRSALIVNFGG